MFHPFIFFGQLRDSSLEIEPPESEWVHAYMGTGNIFENKRAFNSAFFFPQENMSEAQIFRGKDKDGLNTTKANR
jgi:hypothetical protein